MLNDEISVNKIDELTGQIIEAMRIKPELLNSLNPVLETLERVKVATLEMKELCVEFNRGDLTEDTYLNRRKKLRTDIVSAQNRLRLELLDNVIEKVEEKETKSRLKRIKETIVSNKDLIVFVGQLVATFLGKPQ